MSIENGVRRRGSCVDACSRLDRAKIGVDRGEGRSGDERSQPTSSPRVSTSRYMHKEPCYVTYCSDEASAALTGGPFEPIALSCRRIAFGLSRAQNTSEYTFSDEPYHESHYHCTLPRWRSFDCTCATHITQLTSLLGVGAFLHVNFSRCSCGALPSAISQEPANIIILLLCGVFACENEYVACIFPADQQS